MSHTVCRSKTAVRLLFETSAGPSVSVRLFSKQLSVYFRKHLLQKQLLLFTVEPSAGHVVKYYKRI